MLFVTNVNMKPNEGIFKKIFAQANGLQLVAKGGWLITKSDFGSQIYNFCDGTVVEEPNSVLFVAKRICETAAIEVVYIRHMIPSVNLVLLLKWLKKEKIKVLYEIPTYPYYAEQFRTSHKKYRAIAKLGLDTIFWPIIYRYIDRLLVIKSNSRVHMFKKMYEICNGANINEIKEKTYIKRNDKCISMVAVGTIYPYHGYDRLLEGLKKYNQQEGKMPVELHVIGSSNTIDELQSYSLNEKISNVFFHGIKSTSELNELYEYYDIGIGALSLRRRNADIDTTIKIIEYYCRGVPVVTSGISPMDKYNPMFTIHIPDDREPVDIEYIINSYYNISEKELKSISKTARDIFSWDNIMNQIYNNI